MSLRLFLLFFFVFSSFSFFLAVSLFSSLYLLTRKKKERANKRNYFSCIRLMNFFINMQAVACNAFISRGWLAGREREREKKKSSNRSFLFSFQNKLHVRLGSSASNFFSLLLFCRFFARFAYDSDPLCIKLSWGISQPYYFFVPI